VMSVKVYERSVFSKRPEVFAVVFVATNNL
jgi:hypothetical protein